LSIRTLRSMRSTQASPLRAFAPKEATETQRIAWIPLATLRDHLEATATDGAITPGAKRP
jgi:hypothetical protein